MALTLQQLRPAANERAILVGATGTGKTTLGRQLLQAYDTILVIDSKCTFGGKRGEPGYRMVSTPSQACVGAAKGRQLIQYRP
jgi:hypothetical protein